MGQTRIEMDQRHRAHLLPLEEALTTGGDTRLLVDRDSGRNRYGCLPRPSAAIPFGSCTASTVSTRGFAAAGRIQQSLLDSDDGSASGDRCCENIRRRLEEMLGFPEGVEIMLAPSGTDAELIAAALALGDGARPLVNIVVGPDEVGSGTTLAAAGLHYDELLPNGRRVTVGEPVDRSFAARIRVETVRLRGDDAIMHDEEHVDALVSNLVSRAAAEGARVLVHVVAHSKTGVHAPSLRCVERLRREHDDMCVLIDAAQGRFSRRGLKEVLQNGDLVLLTGSKFYSGPPFSGSLLVPEEMGPDRRGVETFPTAFSDYFTSSEMPEAWRSIRASMPDQPNFGLILRWYAALAEMDAYYESPAEGRLAVLRAFEAELPVILGASPAIELLPVFAPLYDDQVERLLESKTTVFSFRVRSPDSDDWLSRDELVRIRAELNSEVSDRYPWLDPATMGAAFHIGQPVHVRNDQYVLRIALGGELIVRVATDPRLGETVEQRLDWLREQIRGFRDKLEALAGFGSGGNLKRL